MSRTYAELDPVASDVGHGAPGLRDNLRPFSELVTQSAAQRHVYVAVRPARLLTGWSNYSTDGSNSGVYVIPWRETWDGILRDVVGMRTTSETLTRAETLAACVATAGTYYYDADQVVGSYNLWDDGTVWDGGELWDAGLPLLYCHLTGGADPDATSVQALCGFYYGTDSVVQPTLGVEKLTNGDLETWSAANNAGTWTEGAYGTGGGSVARDTGIDGVGTYSAKISGALNAAGGQGISQPVSNTVGGKLYRFSGWYKTDATNPAGIEARIRVGIPGGGPVTTALLLSDGRNVTTGTTGFALADTHGYARRFSFDLVCPNDDAFEVAAFAWNSTGGALTAAGVWFDGLSLKRIWRFERYESRMELESVPASEVRRTDAYHGPIARGSGTITLVNANGHFEPVIGGLDWLNLEFVASVGGRFVNGGNEILAEDLYPHLTALVTERPVVNDVSCSIPFEDIQAKLATLLPPNTYGVEEFPNLLDADRGRRKAMVFGGYGSGLRAKPVCISTTGYGQWEAMDVSGSPAPNGFGGASQLFSYLDEDAATRDDTSKRATVTVTYDSNSRASLTQCPKVFQITPDNNVFEFNIGGGTLTVSIAPGVYLMGTSTGTGDTGTVLGLLRAAINTATGDTNTTTVLDSTTYKVTIARSAGTFQILTSSGTLRNRGLYGILGYSATADYTGALTYTAENAVFSSVREVVLRVGVLEGYQDDTSGTYTGTASGSIMYPQSVARMLLVCWAGIPQSMIDNTSFTSGLGLAPQRVPYAFLYLGVPGSDSEEIRAIIERLENSDGHELIWDRDKFYWRTQQTSASATASVSLTDRDYLSFEAVPCDAGDVYSIVRAASAQDPVSGAWKMTQTSSALTKLRFGREEQRTFYTYLSADAANPAITPDLTDVYQRRDDFADEAWSKRRRFYATVKGSLFTYPLGTVVSLTRTKGLDPTGALNDVRARLVGKVDNLLTWETRAELIELVG